jgi:ribosomal protein S27AE
VLRLERRRRELRHPFCPKCDSALRNVGGRLACPRCGYERLTPEGKLEVEEKMRAALERLLAEQHGTAIAVTLRKLARAAGLGELEYRYAAYRWHKILPGLVEVNGSRWLRSWSDSDRKRVVYVKETAEIAPRRPRQGAARSGVRA